MKGPNLRLVETTPPIMQATAAELRRLLEQTATRNPQLQHVLLNDPAAAVAVYRALGRLRPGACDTVSDAAHAISLIGMQSLREMVETLPTLALDPTRQSLRETAASAYSQASHAAHYANALAGHKGLGGNHEIPTAALLQNPAVLALWAAEPDSAQRATFALRDGVDFETAFGAELGEPVEYANKRLAEAWSLPALARQAMGDWDDFNPRPQMVKLADGLAQTTAAGWHSDALDTITVILAEFLGCEDETAISWLHRETVAAASDVAGFTYPLPAFELPLTGDEDDEECDARIPEFGAWREKKAAPEPAKPAAPSVHDTMVAAMRRIRRDAHTERVVFAVLNRDRTRLKARIALGGQDDDPVRHLDVDAREKNLFGLLMGKQQSVWLHRGNVARYKPYLLPSIRPLFGAKGAYLMSLFVDDKPLGLLYADGPTLSEEDYQVFRQLCHEATETLTGGRKAH
jgi:HD-like signal output (HDOD) protein